MAAHGQQTVAAILVAGGAGQRLGAPQPKAFVSVAGCTLLEHAAHRFLAHPRVRDVIVVVPVDKVAEATQLVPAATVVGGGPVRQSSVACGLQALAGDIDVVLVHDVARAFVPPDVITRVIDAVQAGHQAVIPVVPIADSMRTLHTDGGLGAAADRRDFVAVQTPQGFRRDVLHQAHDVAAGQDAADDAGLVEALGIRICAVPGAPESVKITVAHDLVLAEAMARR